MPKKTSRRSFLKKSASITATSVLAPAVVGLSSKKAECAPSSYNQWPGRCVVNFNSNATASGVLNEAVVKKMVDDSIKALTGQSQVGEAWKSIFPGITLTKKIMIKINVIASSIPTLKEIVKGITDGIQQIVINSTNFPAANITIYDDRRFGDSGYTTAYFGNEIQLTEFQANSGRFDYGDGAGGQPYVAPLRDCDYLINVPVLKGHAENQDFFSIGYKNHHGCYPPQHWRSNYYWMPLHNCTGPVFEKTVLTVVSAIYAKYEGRGPTGYPDDFLTYARTFDPATDEPHPRTIVMSTDPVTAEFQAIKIPKIQEGNSYFLDDMPHYLKASVGIKSHNQVTETYNIGILDESQMDARLIVNEVVAVKGRVTPIEMRDGGIHVFPVPGAKHVFIDIVVTKKIDRIPVRILNVAGRCVKRFNKKVTGVRTKILWNGKDARGRRVSKGIYLVQASIGKNVIAKRLSL